jgi:hypothetical protein
MNSQAKKLQLAAIFTSFILAALFSSASIPANASETRDPEVSSVQLIANYIKNAVSDMSSEEIMNRLELQYIKIHFMDQSGNWTTPEIEEISHKLLPKIVTVDDVNYFIDEIAFNLEQNPYLMLFLDNAINGSYPILFEKLKTEGPEILKDVVTWAMVLENINRANLESPHFLSFAADYWTAERNRVGVSIRDTGVGAYIKMKSVEIPLNKAIDDLVTGDLDPNIWKGWLPFNIWEAVMVDTFSGRGDNAAAGWHLIRNSPAAPVNENLGTGPATITEDGNRLEIRMALPRQWADLYQVWNMAFIAHIDIFPYWIVKLMIPSVTEYQDIPEEYIYRRAVALYTTEQYLFLGGKLYPDSGSETIDWADMGLVKEWGKVNKIVGNEYQEDVNDAR